MKTYKKFENLLLLAGVVYTLVIIINLPGIQFIPSVTLGWIIGDLISKLIQN